MFRKLTGKIDKLKREAFNFRIRLGVGKAEFTLVTNNCLGGSIMQVLARPYNSPFVGLFLHAPCYITLLEDFETNIRLPLTFVDSSKYESASFDRGSKLPRYPIARLGPDIEVHFLHYADEAEARGKWTRRLERMRTDNLAVLFLGRDHCQAEHVQRFAALRFPVKAAFTTFAIDARDLFHREFPGKIDYPYKHKDLRLLPKEFDLISFLRRAARASKE
ncbi:MAG: DUF1919 domain-containing protein [Silvanigrellales bacterium]|jgi:uncharacterized protein (DUF1919 family)|nr:DUF1919 domain-containing protein [Silvanigrellales bacterium]